MRRIGAVLLVCGAALLNGRAHAQGLTADGVAGQAIARACQGNAGQVLTRERLAEALVVESRSAPTLSEMATIAADVARTGSSGRTNTTYTLALRSLQGALARSGSTEAKAITVTPAPPPLRAGAPDWLFDQRYTLTCAPARTRETQQFTRLQPFVVRGSVDALDDVGEDRQAAAAAQVGWDRVRTTNLAGATTRTETFTVDATLGLALGNVDRFIILYGDYSRNRVETRNSAGARDVDDVEALEVGLYGRGRFANIRAAGRVGVTFDEITGARYLRGNLRLTPITGGRGNLGLCNLNSFATIARGIRGRCTLAAEFELRNVLRRGTANIGDTDTLAALGGTIGLEIGPGIDADSNVDDGIVASARYTYLAVVHGALPDIDRLEVSLSYRWWVGDIGFDVGLTYADGTERKSFADENRLGFRIGLIY